jgi:exonuclease VII large subunit
MRLRLRFSGNQTTRSLRRELGHRVKSVDRSAPRSVITTLQSSTTRLRRTMSLPMSRRLSAARLTVSDRAARANRHQAGFLRERRLFVKILDAKLTTLDPRSVLDRGYAALISSPDGRPIHSSQNLAAGDVIEANLRDGRIVSTVKQVLPTSQAVRNTDGQS